MRLFMLLLSLLDEPPARPPVPASCTLKGKVAFSSPDSTTKASDLVVYVSSKPKSVKLSPQKRFEIAQVGRQFVPRTLIIQVADSVAFPNRDNMTHSVFSVDGTTVRIPPTSKAEPQPATFTREGGFGIRCDMHSNMRAWVMVVPVRELAAEVHEDGTWRINGVPAGSHTLRVVEPNGATTKIDVSACDSDTSIDTTLEGNESPPVRRFDGSPYLEYQSQY
jgi:plastocyanin